MRRHSFLRSMASQPCSAHGSVALLPRISSSESRTVHGWASPRDASTAALRETAEREHRSMHDVALQAVVGYTSARSRRRDELLAQILDENTDAPDRLAKA